MLDREHVAALFPFYFRVDDAGCLRDLGDSLAKAVPDAKEGLPARELFRAIRRPVALEPEALAQRTEELFLLETLSNGVVLRGRFIPVEGGLGFFGSPWFRDLRSLEGCGLSFADFALQDPVPDYLMLLQTVAASLRDTTRLAERLGDLRDEAEKANRTKSDFLAVMSHEIRTPLNVVLGMTELLRETALSEDQRGCVDAVAGNSKLLRRLISNVLDVSKIESGQLALEEVSFDALSAIEDAVESLASRARAKGLRLLFDGPRPPVMLVADEMRLRQVVLNLVGNAIKFTEEGIVSVAVACTPQPQGSTRLTIRVKDSGVGIGEEKLETIFERFVQGSTSTTRTSGGSGLGLHIARSLAELMGGSLEVRSELGVGSVFTFQASLRDAGVAKRGHLQAVPSHAPRPGLRVMVVEDTQDNRILMKRFLELEGCEVLLAEHGEDALARLSVSRPPDLILLDVEMPVMDGISCAARIRAWEAREGRERVPIVALTAHALAGFRDRCLASGMDAYVTKPIERATLREALVRWSGPAADATPKRPLDRARISVVG